MRVNKKIKTKELLQKQITEYAYINSHLLRSPLSSILGLVHVAEIEDADVVRDKEWLQHLKASCVELDRVINRINRLLAEENSFSRKDV